MGIALGAWVFLKMRRPVVGSPVELGVPFGMRGKPWDPSPAPLRERRLDQHPRKLSPAWSGLDLTGHDITPVFPFDGNWP